MNTPEDKRGRSATRSEKAVAFNALSREDRGRLLSYASYKAKDFAGHVNYADKDDLLQEALVRALENTRKWYPDNVSFFGFLCGCVRSIASDWYKKARTTDLSDDPPEPRRHDRETEAVLMLEKIREAARDRPHAAEILDLKLKGLKAKEIQKQLGIDARIFGAAMKWIQRLMDEEGFRQ